MDQRKKGVNTKKQKRQKKRAEEKRVKLRLKKGQTED